MNSSNRRSRSSARPPRPAASVRGSQRAVNLSPELVWHHLGKGYRVTLWPEVAFEREVAPDLWRPFTPDPRSDAFCTGAVMVTKRQWAAYLDFCPPAWRTVVERFSFHRLYALTALAYAPAMLKAQDFVEYPVLALLVAAHPALRDTLPEWGELNAVRDRGTVFEILAWLGFPSTRACLDHLAALDPDLPVRDLERVREILWSHHEAMARPVAPASHGHALAA